MEKTLIEFQIYLNDKGLIKLINNLAIACNCFYNQYLLWNYFLFY
jgi:hypothetical protein